MELPDSAVLAWWSTAWLRGHVGTDHVLDAVTHGDVPHTVVEPDDVTGGLLDLLLLLRRSGVDGAGLALPAEGDPVGLGGPPSLTTAALESGEALVAGPVAAVPTRVGASVSWQLFAAHPRQLTDVGEADRGLRTAFLDAANRLADLDVARWQPDLADELLELRRGGGLDAPPGTPERCVGLASRAARALRVCELALTDDGGALTAAEAAARRDPLTGLARAGRRALVAACSPEVWPG